jgi:SRSO17 transposase
VRLAEVSGGEFAHDAANRFLNREDFSPRDLFEEVRSLIDLEDGILSVDDTVLDKPYSQEGKTDLVGYFYSGLHGKAVKGINLVTLFYADSQGVRVPVNFRAVDKTQGETKNDLFREMIEEVLSWGLRPLIVTADSWYSGVENLRLLRDQGLSFMIALEKNRTVSEQAGEHLRVENAELPQSGKVMYLRHFGWVSVFRTVDKDNDVRHDAAFDPRKKAHESRRRLFLPCAP